MAHLEDSHSLATGNLQAQLPRTARAAQFVVALASCSFAVNAILAHLQPGPAFVTLQHLSPHHLAWKAAQTRW
jgi:hypothetical protein